MIKEITDEEEAKINDDNNQIIETKVETDADIKKKLNEEIHKIDLAEIDEGGNDVKEEDVGTRRLLKGFKHANIKIHLMSGKIQDLIIKKKYTSFFDAAILSIHSANMIDEPINTIFKNGAKIHVETADFLCILKPENKTQYREKINEKCVAAKWKICKDPPYKHHVLYEVVKEETATPKVEEVEDDFDLD